MLQIAVARAAKFCVGVILDMAEARLAGSVHFTQPPPDPAPAKGFQIGATGAVTVGDRELARRRWRKVLNENAA